MKGMEEIYNVVVKQMATRKSPESVVPSVEAYSVHTVPVSKVKRVEAYAVCTLPAVSKTFKETCAGGKKPHKE